MNYELWVVWITCGLLWCFYQLFGLSFWRHPFTSIAETLMQRHISTNLMKKQTHPNLAWAHFQPMFIFVWTVPSTGLVSRPGDDSLGGLVLVLCFACACGECALQHVIVFTGDFAYDMHEVRNTHILTRLSNVAHNIIIRDKTTNPAVSFSGNTASVWKLITVTKPNNRPQYSLNHWFEFRYDYVSVWKIDGSDFSEVSDDGLLSVTFIYRCFYPKQLICIH